MKKIKSLTLKILISLTGCFYLMCCTPAHAFVEEAVNYNNAGINHTKKGDYEQAITDFKKAVDCDSSLTNAYYNLGSVYRYIGNKDKALRAFQLLLRNSPGDDEAAYLVADLYYEKQDYEKALIYLNSVDKTSASYKDSLTLFKKINQKINDSVIDDAVKPSPASVPDVNKYKLTFRNFTGPTGIAEDSQGNLYAANYLSDTIQVVQPDGKPLRVIKNDFIKGPVGIAIDAKDNLYVANYASNNVIKIDTTGAVKIVLKDVVKPYYLYFNKSGVLYVSEQDKNTVIRIGVPE